MLMNRGNGEARLLYGPSAFRVLRHGQYVTCAVSGVKIPLEELRYWSVERQEPYASAEIATRRFLER